MQRIPAPPPQSWLSLPTSFEHCDASLQGGSTTTFFRPTHSSARRARTHRPPSGARCTPSSASPATASRPPSAKATAGAASSSASPRSLPAPATPRTQPPDDGGAHRQQPASSRAPNANAAASAAPPLDPEENRNEASRAALQPSPHAAAAGAPAHLASLARSQVRNARDYLVAQQEVQVWQEDAARESEGFESTRVWIDMMVALANMPSDTVSGKLTRVEAAAQILRKLGKLFQKRYGDAYEWATQQFLDCIFVTEGEGFSQHDPNTCVEAAEVERLCMESGARVTYFQVYATSLVCYARARAQNHRQRLSLESLHRVLDCALGTYRLKIKGFVFNSWRKYTAVEKKHSRALVQHLRKNYRLTRVRVTFQHWRTVVRIEKSQVEKREAEHDNKRLVTQLRALEKKFAEVTCAQDHDIDTLRVELAMEREKSSGLTTDLAAMTKAYEEERAEKTEQVAELSEKVAVKEVLLVELAPGHCDRRPPSGALLHCARRLCDVVANPRLPSKAFGLLQQRGMEALVATWVMDKAGASTPPSLEELVSDKRDMLEAMLANASPTLLPPNLSVVAMMRRCFAKAEYTSPPMCMLCQTHAATELLTDDFMESPLFNNKMLRVLCSLLLIECYLHLGMEALPLTGIDPATLEERPREKERAARPDKLEKSARRAGDRTTARLAMHALKSMQNKYEEEDYLEAPLYDEPSEKYKQLHRAFTEEEQTAKACNLAWTGIGALVHMFLAKAKQREILKTMLMPQEGGELGDAPELHQSCRSPLSLASPR